MRRFEVTASARILPARTCTIAEGTSTTPSGTCPPSTSVDTGPLPLYGTGRSFTWDRAADLAARRAVILAGGLGPDNVADALERVCPFGVDAASRLESAPGIKDHDLVRRFVGAVRRHDAKRGAA